MSMSHKGDLRIVVTRGRLAKYGHSCSISLDFIRIALVEIENHWCKHIVVIDGDVLPVDGQV